MTEKVFYGVIIACIVAVVALIVLMYVYRRQGKIAKEQKIKALLMRIGYYSVSLVEAIYRDGNGKKKLDEATKIVRSKLPAGASDLISDEMIHKYLESALADLQVVFKGKKADEISMLNKIIDVGSSSPDAKAAIELAKNMRDSKGYIEGYAEGRTNFHGQSEAAVGIRGGVKL
ncbi:hypothetical protein IX317_000472 [Fusobacterium sp. DD29]|uniref:phage holin, LLH family n=1 Tax=unclassified Fusobacterium TaxID=2648384 RepID=UPI001B8BF742|nr:MULTISPECIES: phage holin, LLH family [unclassified Fusobacterium]MBR8700222.1 hypothetical protein [Fusobacterium sp. DD45]MBR8710327.1 hypothetical protein [Fusobacterium sp. DD28]MBR8748811.1 hypothetical protein [Fusobacterium sp. DD29]MBR8750944.1 hypothetical protein [Fusobacterium sp. DD26]MBR8761032.1 hypothetical protein [Fusobacterium sp. DD25]